MCAERDEWIRLMLEIAATDRDKYRELRAEAWRLVQVSHEQKTPEQISEWNENAS